MQTPVNISIYFVPVLKGAPEALVAQRELRNKYETNRAIKTWSVFFLLKSLTSSGVLKKYKSQENYLADFCQCNVKTLRRRIEELKQLKLVSIAGENLILIAYHKAAALLNITYNGIFKIKYDTSETQGNQIFQHLLRAEEIRNNQQKQLQALIYRSEKNPLITEQLMPLFANQGCSLYRIRTDAHYFQEQLLKLQQKAFIEGSALLEEIQSFRADVNRGVLCMQQQHQYKSAQSVSYMKKKLKQHKLIGITKRCIHSKERTRLYVPSAAGGRQDGYKWLPQLKKTAWFLTDQINVLTSSTQQNEKEERKQKAA